MDCEVGIGMVVVLWGDRGVLRFENTGLVVWGIDVVLGWRCGVCFCCRVEVWVVGGGRFSGSGVVTFCVGGEGQISASDMCEVIIGAGDSLALRVGGVKGSNPLNGLCEGAADLLILLLCTEIRIIYDI